MAPQLPPELIGRIVHYCQPRHSLLLANHQANRRDIHRRLSRVSRVWETYATEEASQYLAVRLESDEGDESALSLSQAEWGKWTEFDFKDCRLRFQPRYLSVLSSKWGRIVDRSMAGLPEDNSGERIKLQTTALMKACTARGIQEAYFDYLDI